MTHTELDLKIKILIVNDMDNMRKLMVDACHEIGLQSLTEATDTAEAWQKIIEETPPFQLILSEWEMKPASGLDLLKRLRRDHRIKNTPFILFTSEATKEKIIRAAQAGVSAYIVKPFTSKTLQEKMIEAIKKPIKIH